MLKIRAFIKKWWPITRFFLLLILFAYLVYAAFNQAFPFNVLPFRLMYGGAVKGTTEQPIAEKLVTTSKQMDKEANIASKELKREQKAKELLQDSLRDAKAWIASLQLNVVAASNRSDSLQKVIDSTGCPAPIAVTTNTGAVDTTKFVTRAQFNAEIKKLKNQFRKKNSVKKGMVQKRRKSYPATLHTW